MNSKKFSRVEEIWEWYEVGGLCEECGLIKEGVQKYWDGVSWEGKEIALCLDCREAMVADVLERHKDDKDEQ